MSLTLIAAVHVPPSPPSQGAIFGTLRGEKEDVLSSETEE